MSTLVVVAGFVVTTGGHIYEQFETQLPLARFDALSERVS